MSVAPRRGRPRYSIRGTPPSSLPITAVYSPASAFMEDPPASSSPPAERSSRSTPLPFVLHCDSPLQYPAPCATVYDLALTSIPAGASPIMPSPFYSPVESHSRRFWSFPTPFWRHALDIYGSPASFSASAWFCKRSVLEFSHLLPRYADLSDTLLCRILIQVVFKEDWRHQVAVPHYAMNRKASESPGTCLTRLLEGNLGALEVTFETDPSSSGLLVDMCCPRAAPEYQCTKFLLDRSPFEGSPGSIMVSHWLVL